MDTSYANTPIPEVKNYPQNKAIQLKLVLEQGVNDLMENIFDQKLDKNLKTYREEYL